MTKRKGLRASINEKCKQCAYHPTNDGGSWRMQVEACTVTTCGLWEVRPKSTSSKFADEEDDDVESAE